MRELPKFLLSELIKSPLFWNCLLDTPIPAALPSLAFLCFRFYKERSEKTFLCFKHIPSLPAFPSYFKKRERKRKTMYTAQHAATSDPEMHYKLPVAGFRQAINKTQSQLEMLLGITYSEKLWCCMLRAWLSHSFMTTELFFCLHKENKSPVVRNQRQVLQTLGDIFNHD